MNQDVALQKLEKELSRKIYPINELIPKFNEEIATIKATKGIDLNWFRKLENEKNAKKLLNKYRKIHLDHKDITLYPSLIELLIEDESGFQAQLQHWYDKVLTFKDTYLEKRQAAIEESRMILNGEMGKRGRESNRPLKNIVIDEIKIKKLSHKERNLSNAFIHRAFLQNDKIDFAIGEFLRGISFRGGFHLDENWWGRRMRKGIKSFKKDFSNWEPENKLEFIKRELRHSQKTKREAWKNKNESLVACLNIYQEMLLLRLMIESNYCNYYREKLMLISDYLQSSHRVIE